MRLLFWSGLLVFLADQLTKYIVLYRIDLPIRQVVEVWPPFLVLKMAWNPGINFGLFGGADLRWVLVGIAVAVSLFVIWWVRKETPGRWGMISAGVLVGGALGNALDRVLYEKGVVDFLNMSCCGVENPFAFNIADVAIFVGAVGLILFGPDNKTA